MTYNKMIREILKHFCSSWTYTGYKKYKIMILMIIIIIMQIFAAFGLRFLQQNAFMHEMNFRNFVCRLAFCVFHDFHSPVAVAGPRISTRQWLRQSYVRAWRWGTGYVEVVRITNCRTSYINPDVERTPVAVRLQADVRRFRKRHAKTCRTWQRRFVTCCWWRLLRIAALFLNMLTTGRRSLGVLPAAALNFR